MNSKTGEVTYYHQMLSGTIVHPDFKEVIPFAPEPIIKQDGEKKNDIERNASKRYLEKCKEKASSFTPHCSGGLFIFECSTHS
jgi:hypothetical protein